MQEETSLSNRTLIELASTTYNESELLEIIKFSGSMDELNCQYPIECMRNMQITYRVSYLGNDSVAIILFDDSGDKIVGNLYELRGIKSDYSGLNKGDSLEQVMTIDPNGKYSFLYTGRNDVPRVSSHYTKDGYLITIEYDITNKIVKIREELI